MPTLYIPKSPIHWNWINLSGPDAPDFLHRLTTVDVKNLALSEGRAGCFLTPLGKISASFTLWRLGSNEFGFELDAGKDHLWKKKLLSTIDQYTFGEKFTLVDPLAPAISPPHQSTWLFFEMGVPLPKTLLQLGFDTEKNSLKTCKLSTHSHADSDQIRLCFQGSMHYQRPWLTAWGSHHALSQWMTHYFSNTAEISFETIERWRINSLIPRVDHEITESTIPLEIGLRYAISEQKGCYPGQEVIERILALGSPSRRLVKIEGTGKTPALGEKIFNITEPMAPRVEIGEITSALSTESGFTGLALIRKIHAKEAHPLQLQDGTQATITRVAPYE